MTSSRPSIRITDGPLSGHVCPRCGPAVRPSKRFAAGKTLPQGQFTCPEDVKSSGSPQKTLSFAGIGGMRASIYNAMPMEGVEKLCEFIKAFDKNN